MKIHSLLLVVGVLLFGSAVFAQTTAGDPFGGGEIGVREPLSPVPRTGQMICYEIGDDGDCQAGVSLDPRFTDNGDGTVRDNLTGLIWLQDASCFGRRSWTEALSDANSLADGTCRLADGSAPGDWRLPNIRELHSLADFGQVMPALPVEHPFIGVESDYYWSSSSQVYNPTIAWYLNLRYGFSSAWPKQFVLHVWPVRGGQ